MLLTFQSTYNKRFQEQFHAKRFTVVAYTKAGEMGHLTNQIHDFRDPLSR